MRAGMKNCAAGVFPRGLCPVPHGSDKTRNSLPVSFFA